MTGDTFDRFNERSDRGRGRFGDNEYAPESGSRGPRVTGASDLCDVDLILRNDNPAKKAIAVSRSDDTPFEDWVWLPRSLIEYEAIGMRGIGSPQVRVTLPQRLAREKGLK